MDFLQIMAATLCVAVLYFACRTLACRVARAELLHMGAELGAQEIALLAEEETLEYALRCALLIANGRLSVSVRIPRDESGELYDIAARLAARHPNLVIQMM